MARIDLRLLESTRHFETRKRFENTRQVAHITRQLFMIRNYLFFANLKRAETNKTIQTYCKIFETNVKDNKTNKLKKKHTKKKR